MQKAVCYGDGDGGLVDGVLQLIFCKLPFSSLPVAAAVCRRWYDLIFGEKALNFMDQYDASCVPQFWVVVHLLHATDEPGEDNANALLLFDTQFQRWVQFELAVPRPNIHYQIRAGSTGLLCFLECNVRTLESCLQVCNPVKNLWKRVQWGAFMRTPLAGVVDGRAIFFVNDQPHTYDISSGALLSVGKQGPEGIRCPHPVSSNPLCGFLKGQNGLEAVVTYDIEADSWSVLEFEELEELLKGDDSTAELFYFPGGKLFLIDVTGDEEDWLAVWRLNTSRKPCRWEEVSRRHVEDMVDEATDNFEFSSDSKSHIWIVGIGCTEMLNYNIDTDQWTVYPGYDIPDEFNDFNAVEIVAHSACCTLSFRDLLA